MSGEARRNKVKDKPIKVICSNCKVEGILGIAIVRKMYSTAFTDNALGGYVGGYDCTDLCADEKACYSRRANWPYLRPDELAKQG